MNIFTKEFGAKQLFFDKMIYFLVLQSSFAKEMGAGYLALIVFLMPCYCKGLMALPHGALVGLKCVIVVFSENSYLLFIYENLDFFSL